MTFTVILANLKKTMEALFDEVTFKINVDFELTISLWFYEEDFGWTAYEEKMFEGAENYIMVCKQ